MNPTSFIFKKDDCLSSFTKDGGETRLLAKAEDVEVHKQTIAAKRTFWLDSGEEWQGFEFIYILTGQLLYLDATPPGLLEPGDYIARHLVLERAYFEAKTETVLLYISSQPAFKMLSEETKDYVQLAQQIEKDEYTEGHCNRISYFGRLLGSWMDLPGERLHNLGFAAFFHDVGKAKVPRTILQKTDALNEEEWAIIRQHTVWGRDMLAQKPLLKDAGLIVGQTHERVDGQGYPDGLRGEAICLEAKIIAVVDAYDAMTTDRSYRKGLTQQEAVGRLRQGVNAQFDAQVVEAFVEMLREQDLHLPEFDRELVRLKRHEAFLRIGEEILSDHDIQQILDHVVRAIVENTPFQRAALALYAKPIRPESTEEVGITRVACVGLSPEEERRLKAHPLPSHERARIFDPAFNLSRSYYIPHHQLPWLEHPGLIRGEASDSDQESGWHPDDFLCIPMTVGHQIIGIISVDEPVDGQAPTVESLEPIEIFSNFAALAIERTRHTRQLNSFQDRLKGIYRLSEKLSEVDTVEELIDQVMTILTESFSYDQSTLFFKEKDVLELKGFNSRLPEDEIFLENFQRLWFDQGIAGWVATHRKPALVDDVRQDERYIFGHQAIRSELAVPIEDQTELVGILNLESVRIGAFSQEDLELAQALSRQLGAAINNLRRQQQLQDTLDEREWYNKFLQSLVQAQGLEELLELIIRRGIELLAPKADAGTVLLWHEGEEVFEFEAAVNRDLDALRAETFFKDRLVQGSWDDHQPSILTRTQQLARQKTLNIETPPKLQPPASTISMPIHDGERLIAIFNINNLEQEGVFGEEDTQKIWCLVPEIELALSRARDRERLRSQAIHDPLTQVYNRRFLSEMLDRSATKAQTDVALSLIMIDVVDFHRVNDRFGHLQGDRILREAAGIFKQCMRDSDAVIRYGGDEFLIVLHDTQNAAAQEVCQRLKADLRAHEWGLPIEITIQTGIATWEPGSGQVFEDVLEEADAWLYRQRRSSKVK